MKDQSNTDDFGLWRLYGCLKCGLILVIIATIIAGIISELNS